MTRMTDSLKRRAVLLSACIVLAVFTAVSYSCSTRVHGRLFRSGCGWGYDIVCNGRTVIHQPFILDGLTSWGYEAERDYIAKVAMGIKKYGYKLTLLIHPREDVERYRKLYETSDIIIKQNINKKDYKEYSLAIGYYSTALLYPVFLHIPLLIIDYGEKVKATDSPFYPLTCSLTLENFAELMQKYDTYIREYIGTSECSFEHMAYVLDKNIVID